MPMHPHTQQGAAHANVTLAHAAMPFAVPARACSDEISLFIKEHQRSQNDKMTTHILVPASVSTLPDFPVLRPQRSHQPHTLIGPEAPAAAGRQTWPSKRGAIKGL